MKITVKDWLLLIVFTLVTLAANAQYLPYSGEKFRTITEFKMDRKFAGDTLVNILIRSKDTTATSMMLVNGRDTTAMYQIRDTAFMSTTARIWKFKPTMPCCLPKGNKYQVAYFGNDSILTSDNGFIFSDTLFRLLVQNNTLSANTNIIRSQNDILTLGVPIGNITVPHHTINIDTNGITFNHAQSNINYLFPNDTGSVGKALTVISKSGNKSTLGWSNQTLSGSATLNFGSIGAHDYEDLTLTVTGATDGDVVSIGVTNAAAVAKASYFGWVSASNTVTIRCFNIDGGSVNPPSALFKVKVFK
jgi:hypothetical protein